jgi:predicted nucleic acid-binding protein
VTGWLLDTNVISELRRPRPNANVIAFVSSRVLEDLYVSTVTMAEIRYGVELVTDPVRRGELDEWLANRIRPMFLERVLPVCEDVLVRWRLLVEAGRKAGSTFSLPDLLIGATALHHGLIVVTRNTKEYARAHIPVMNPWEEQR